MWNLILNKPARLLCGSVLVMSLCVACGKRENAKFSMPDMDSTTPSATIRPAAIVGQYAGVLPTDDHASIKTVIDLYADAKFTLNQTYIRPNTNEANGKQPEVQGSWIVNDKQTLIQLQVDSAVPGNIMCFAVGSRGITKYQSSCQPIDQAHPAWYTLKKSALQKPTS